MVVEVAHADFVLLSGCEVSRAKAPQWWRPYVTRKHGRRGTARERSVWLQRQMQRARKLAVRGDGVRVEIVAFTVAIRTGKARLVSDSELA